MPGASQPLALREVRRILRYRKLAAFHRITNRMAPELRARLLGAPLAVVEPRAARNPGSALAAPAAVLLLWELGRTQDAIALVDRTAPMAGPATLVRLARVWMAVGEVGRAKPLVDRLPEGYERASLEAEFAFAAGRFTDALAMAETALGRPGDHRRHRRVIERARAELEVLDPAWRPPLPRVAARGGGPRPGRILHVLTNSLPHLQSGYTVRAQQVAVAQRAAGLDPHMVTRAGFPLVEGRAGRAVDLVDGIAYHRIAPGMPLSGAPGVIVTRTAAGLERLAAELRPAVLHPTTNFLNAQAALAVCESLGIRLVYEVRGFLEETWVSRIGDDAKAADRYLRGREMETACMAAADAVVTLSETMKADIVARGIAADRVTVIPNAVDAARFTPRARDDALAGRLGIAPGEIVLGYISSMVRYEGIRYLIEATRLLRDRGRRVRLLLVGDGEERGALEERAEELGLRAGRAAIFTGRVPHAEIEAYYSIIDLFVVPRTADRVSQLVTPLKPYEAMAMQRCLVVSGVGALLEIVQDGETGRSFTPEDPAALADALEPLLDDPVERERLGHNARAWVLEHRTWERNGALYREVYERLGALR
jgi:PEP-CTERM/exosortase A-associated glycosyltransferase